MISRRFHFVLTLTFLLALAAVQPGCTDKTFLIPAPTLNLKPEGKRAFDAIPPKLRTSEMDLIYASDRSVTRKTVLGIEYGTGRSGALAFGTAKVSFDPALSWDQLLRESTSKDSSARPSMKLGPVTELGILAVPLQQMEVREGRYMLTDSATQLIAQGRTRLRELVAERMSASGQNDVYIFVHGFNNTFSDAMFRLAMVWQMAARPGVAIAYTWPAGHGGVFGYAYDRESGDFTISHFRRFIKEVAAIPQVQRIHIVAHSRGTAVVIAALRELRIESRAQGLQVADVYKLDDVVLAAPDMDAEEFEQRFAIEDLHLAANRVTIYLSPTDFALSVSRWLFGGGSRLGNLRLQDFTPESRDKLSHLKGFAIIDCNVTGYSTSHDYAFVHPAVVSDLILLLRDHRPPGAANGRPLSSAVPGIWEITNDYLK